MPARAALVSSTAPGAGHGPWHCAAARWLRRRPWTPAPPVAGGPGSGGHRLRTSADDSPAHRPWPLGCFRGRQGGSTAAGTNAAGHGGVGSVLRGDPVGSAGRASAVVRGTSLDRGGRGTGAAGGPAASPGASQGPRLGSDLVAGPVNVTLSFAAMFAGIAGLAGTAAVRGTRSRCCSCCRRGGCTGRRSRGRTAVALLGGFTCLLLVAVPGGGGQGALLSLTAAAEITTGTLLSRRIGGRDVIVATGWHFLIGWYGRRCAGGHARRFPGDRLDAALCCRVGLLIAGRHGRHVRGVVHRGAALPAGRAERLDVPDAGLRHGLGRAGPGRAARGLDCPRAAGGIGSPVEHPALALMAAPADRRRPGADGHGDPPRGRRRAGVGG